jgi:hypothetical protein
MPIFITGVTTGTSGFFPPDYVATKIRPCGDQMRVAEVQATRPRHGLVMSWLIGPASRSPEC